MPCKNSNREWYILNNKLKVEINDAAFSKRLWSLVKIF